MVQVEADIAAPNSQGEGATCCADCWLAGFRVVCGWEGADNVAPKSKVNVISAVQVNWLEIMDMNGHEGGWAGGRQVLLRRAPSRR